MDVRLIWKSVLCLMIYIWRNRKVPQSIEEKAPGKKSRRLASQDNLLNVVSTGCVLLCVVKQVAEAAARTLSYGGMGGTIRGLHFNLV